MKAVLSFKLTYPPQKIMESKIIFKKDEMNMEYICIHVLPQQLHHEKLLPNVKIYSDCKSSTNNSTLPPTLCCSHSVNICLQKEDTYQRSRYSVSYPGT